MNFDSDQDAITPGLNPYIKFDTTGAVWMAAGTTAERPASPQEGFTRYNSTLTAIEYWNGTAWTSPGGLGGTAAAIAVYVPGKPTASQQILRIDTVIDYSSAINFAGSKASAAIAATGAVSYTVKRNGTAIGTINFAAAASVGTFVAAAAITFAPATDDIMSIEAPVAPDATLSDVSIKLKVTRLV